MKKLYPLLVFLLTFHSVFAQGPAFEVTLTEKTIPGFPAIQSFVTAREGSKWLIIGGRTDGLHLRRPFETFLASENNTLISVIDIDSGNVWNAALDTLPTSIFEQLQSTNMEFEQVGNTLYIIGGYGYSSTAFDHITYPNLTAVDVPGVIAAIESGADINPFFRQITDSRLRITGGYLDKMGDTYYLAGGQNFEGRYNPMGPGHGPGFFQEYSNEIRSFEIDDDGTTLSITNYKALRDTMHLHRRDYNMAPQIFPDGTEGFTMFSGVFQHHVDLPWLNTVDIKDDTFEVVAGFNQYLNQYHTAHVPIYDSSENKMYTMFFGGIARYTLNDTGYLVDDPDVPFVKTISCVIRYGDGAMEEYKMPNEMPGFLGSGAEFIPDPAASWLDRDILDLAALPASPLRIGWVVGGIESTAENIFFVNDGSQSQASTRIFEVWLDKTITGRSEIPFKGGSDLQLEVYPNPSLGKVEISFENAVREKISIRLLDMNGKLLKEIYQGTPRAGKHKVRSNLTVFPYGNYLIQISNGQDQRSLKIALF